MPKVADHPTQDQALNLPVTRVGGRFVTKYDPDIALQIVERVAEGETISKICEKGSGFPHAVTFKRWVINNPILAKALDAARLLSAQAMEEEALDVARSIRAKQRDGTEVRAAEVLLQQLRWSMERRDAAKFGNKVPVSIRVPIQINTTLDMGAAIDGMEDGKSIYTISASHNVSPQAAIEASHSVEITDQVSKEGQKPEFKPRKRVLVPPPKANVGWTK